MMGKLAVITGTVGLGLEAACQLARQGCSVILGGRNAAAGAAAVARLRGEAPAVDASFLQVDLAELKSVAEFAHSVASRVPQVDILINNAGVMSPPQRRLTADGMELQFGVNHLAHFALTAHLLPLLQKKAGARVVSVTSMAHRYGDMDLDDLQGEKSYHPGIQYCRSKLAQALFARELQRRSDVDGWGIDSIAAHPGFARTGLFNGKDRGGERVGPLIGAVVGHIMGQSAKQGARSIIHAAIATEARGGALYGPAGLFEMRGRPVERQFAPNAGNQETALRLWEISTSLAQTRFAA